jgi:hypothetical protein
MWYDTYVITDLSVGSAENFWKFLSSMIITLKVGVRSCSRAESCVLVRHEQTPQNTRYVHTQAHIKFSRAQTHSPLPINLIYTCKCARTHTRTSQTRISQPSSGPNTSVKFDQTKVPSMTWSACLQKKSGVSPQGEGHWGYSSAESVAASACDLCQISDPRKYTKCRKSEPRIGKKKAHVTFGSMHKADSADKIIAVPQATSPSKIPLPRWAARHCISENYRKRKEKRSFFFKKKKESWKAMILFWNLYDAQ